MAVKQYSGLKAPDGSDYVTLTDGAGNLISGNVGASVATTTTPADATSNTNVQGQNNLSYNMVYNGTTWDRQRTAVGDAQAVTGIEGNANMVFNGTTWDRLRTIANATQSTGTGVAATSPFPTGLANSAIANTASSAVAAAQVLKASAGNLYSLNAVSGASAGYLMVFDAIAAPADGTVTPIYCMPIAANSAFFTDFAYPIRCNTGITLVFSTTGPFTKTASTTAFLSGQFI